jgi:hypothetical protein
MAWYRTGTITITNGSTAVTGSGTLWTGNAVAGEALLAPDGKAYEILTVNSNTSITLASGYGGTTASGQSYAILPSQGYIKDLAAQVAVLVSTYSSVVTEAGAGKFTDGTVSLPGISFVSDTDTGLQRVSSNAMAIVAGGVARATASTTGLAVPALTATTLTAGESVISASGSVNALRITQTGAGNALVVEDLTSPDSTPFVIDANGRVIVGHTGSIIDSVGSNPAIQISQTANGSFQSLWTASVSGYPCEFGKSRSAVVGSRGIVSTNDQLAVIRFSGDDGSAFIQAASILAAVDGTPGLNDMPGRLVFSTTADGSATPTERMRIDSAGQTLVTGHLRSTSDIRAGTTFLETISPTNSNSTVTATAASVVAGIRTGTPTAAIELQIPTGTAMDAAFTSLQNSMSFEWSYINLAAATHTCTVTANTDHTLVGNMVVQPNSSARFLTRKSTTNTFITYRIA